MLTKVNTKWNKQAHVDWRREKIASMKKIFPIRIEWKNVYREREKIHWGKTTFIFHTPFKNYV